MDAQECRKMRMGKNNTTFGKKQHSIQSHLFLHCNVEDSKSTRATKGLHDNYLQIAAAAMEVPQETQMQVVCVRAKGDQAGKKLANTIKSARSSNRMALGQLLQRAMANLTTDMMRLVAHVNKRLDVLEAIVAAQGARIATLEADVGVLKGDVLDLKSSVAKLQDVLLTQGSSQARPPLRGLARAGSSSGEFLGDPSSHRPKYPLTLHVVYVFKADHPCAPAQKVQCEACYYSLTFEHVLARARQVVLDTHPTSRIAQLEMGYLCGKVTQSMLPNTIREFYATTERFMQVQMTIPVLVQLAATAPSGAAASTSEANPVQLAEPCQSSESEPLQSMEPARPSETAQSAVPSVEQTATVAMRELATEDPMEQPTAMAADNVDDDEEVQDRCQDDEEVKEDAKVKNTKVNKLKPNQKKSYIDYLDMGFDPELALTAARMDLDVEEAIEFFTGNDEFRLQKCKAHVSATMEKFMQVQMTIPVLVQLAATAPSGAAASTSEANPVQLAEPWQSMEPARPSETAQSAVPSVEQTATVAMRELATEDPMEQPTAMAADNVDDDEEVQDRCQDDEEVKEDAKVKNTKVNKLKPNQKKSYIDYLDMGFDPELALTAARMDLDMEEAIEFITGNDEFRLQKCQAHDAAMKFHHEAQLSGRKRSR